MGDEELAAPGTLEAVRTFVNSRDLELGLEAFDTPHGLRDWLAGRDLLEPGATVSAIHLRRAVALREGLRGLMLANATGDPPPAEALVAVRAAGRRAPLRVGAGPDGLALEPAGPGADAALGRLLAIVVLAQADGTWARMKACPGDDCRWALYDRTRSRTRTWCAAAKCGARARARSYRERRRAVGR